MKRLFLILTVLAAGLESLAQVPTYASDIEGWKINPMPVFGYYSELGFEFGAMADVYNYGTTPSVYPGYLDRIHIETTCFTGGQGTASVEYVSRSLIDGITFSAAAGYRTNKLNRFYGFGGDVTEYDSSIDCRNGVAFYCFDKKTANFLVSLDGQAGERLRWMGGVSVWYNETGETQSKKYDGANSLYHLYRIAGIISDKETRGWTAEFKAGIRYDSRNRELSPDSGICSDLSVYASPDLFSTGYSYAKVSAHFRHYLTPGPEWLTFAYHLAYQGTVVGEAPFYLQQNIYSFDLNTTRLAGLGGIETIRGMLSGRLTGKGYAWANLEARIRLFEFSMAGVGCSFGINPFFDCGAIVQPYKINEISAATGKDIETLKKESASLHGSAGLGLKLDIGHSSIMSLEMAKSFKSNDGPFQIALGVNYIF